MIFHDNPIIYIYKYYVNIVIPMETPMFDIPEWFKNANVDLPRGVKQQAMEVSGEIIDCAASAMCSLAALRFY